MGRFGIFNQSTFTFSDVLARQDSKWITGVLSTSAQACSPNLQQTCSKRKWTPKKPCFLSAKICALLISVTVKSVPSFQSFSVHMSHASTIGMFHSSCGAPLRHIFAPPSKSIRVDPKSRPTSVKHLEACRGPSIISRPQSDFSWMQCWQSTRMLFNLSRLVHLVDVGFLSMLFNYVPVNSSVFSKMNVEHEESYAAPIQCHATLQTSAAVL